MLALIDFFEFDIHGTDLEALISNTYFKYARHERLGNFDTFQNVGQYEEDITLNGTLICKSQQQLREFEFLAKLKTNHILTLPDGTCKTILTNDIQKNKSNFLKSGEFLRQEYSISLTVVGAGLSLDLVGLAAEFVGGMV